MAIKVWDSLYHKKILTDEGADGQCDNRIAEKISFEQVGEYMLDQLGRFVPAIELITHIQDQCLNLETNIEFVEDNRSGTVVEKCDTALLLDQLC